MIPKYTEADPLHLAAQLGQTERVREMLQSGLKADSRDHHNITPLMVAARNGFTEIAELLLQAGANINAKDKPSPNWPCRRTPIQHACQVGRAGMMRFLVEHGADVNCCDQNHETPLALVISGGNEALAQYLLDHGANPNTCRHMSPNPTIGHQNVFQPRSEINPGNP